MNYLADIDTSAHDRMRLKYAGFFGRDRPARREKIEDVEDVSLTGYALLYNEPLIYDNEIWYFEPGCFTDALRRNDEIHFQLDHDSSQRMASTRNGLSFFDADIGLLFRVDLDDCKRGAAVKREVESGRRACVSVGIRNDRSDIKTIGKHSVRAITRADLFEVSLVGSGACADAFATTITTSYAPALAAANKSAVFKIAFAAHRMKSMERKIANRHARIQSLVSRLDRLAGKV